MLKRKRLFIILIASIICASLASLGNAKKHTIYLDSSALSTYNHADSVRGDYYTLEFQVPTEITGKELYGVVLELYLDVTGVARTRDTTSVKVPVIEVYALKNTFTGSLESAQVETETGTIQNMPPGQDRKFRIVITEIVRSYIKDSTKNHGLIIGGLAEYREGSFEINSNAFESSYIAKIDFHYNARSGI